MTKTDLWECAKRIRECCQTYRDNPKTDYCRRCPFWYEGVSSTGCLLKDHRGYEIDNPGDWDLD